MCPQKKALHLYKINTFSFLKASKMASLVNSKCNFKKNKCPTETTKQITINNFKNAVLK